MKYSLPNKSPDTQLRAFRAIVDVVTRFPGLRVLCLASGHLRGETSTEVISAIWEQTNTAFGRELIFWQTMAATCLSDMTISAVLEHSTISNLSKCEAGKLNVIETLLVEHGCSGDTVFASALCVRYLAAILELPDFWSDMGPVQSDVNRKLCSEMIVILKDIGVDDLMLGSLPEDSNTLLDYEGADLLATIILRGLSSWIARINKDEWPLQPWYQPSRELLRLLRMPQSEELLPTAAACAASAFEHFEHVYFQEAELTVYVANSYIQENFRNKRDWNHLNISTTHLRDDVAPTESEEAATTPLKGRSSSIHPPASLVESPFEIADTNGQPETIEADEEDVDVDDGRRSVLIGDEDEDEDEQDIPKDLDARLRPEGDGEQKTPTGGIDRESAEATVKAALEGEVDDSEVDIPEPETPEARPVVAVEPVRELPAKPTKVQDVDAIMEEPRAPTVAQEPTPEVPELAAKVPEPAARSEDEGGILKDLDVGLGLEGEPETPMGGVDGESAEATVEGAVEGELDDGERDIPEPKTPEARPVVAVEPVPELPAKPTKVQDADAITEEARAPPTPTVAQEPTPEVQEPAPKRPRRQPAAKVPEPKLKVKEVAPAPEPKPRRSKEQPRTTAAAPVAPPPVPDEELPAPPEVPPKAVKGGAKLSARRPRREKSGVPALDRHLDNEASATETEDDWDFVEAADGEDRNGAKGTSLFARGVVDRYRLAVFRKASTPSRNAMPRSVSAVSRDSDVGAQTDGSDSPSPSQRRGRSGAGLTFRQYPSLFPRAKSPLPSSFSAKPSFTSQTIGQSNSPVHPNAQDRSWMFQREGGYVGVLRLFGGPHDLLWAAWVERGPLGLEWPLKKITI
ncbi:hypothetical protein B0H16DRAFT_1689610 [Mycena metata]|uniref:Uncharacterized protein n=1 Tax=Mycena metata TaxID=1033252 RepID=A0AAD7J5T9_9AGAR|nr:hypothetical protein B0H16DRAFT_1689610 [Mycena metata]